jgi:class 3 adenylate cyclase
MRTAAPAGHLRRAARLAPGLAAAWALAALVVIRLSGIDRLDGSFEFEVTLFGEVLRTVGLGLLIGLPAAWLETGPFPQFGRRVPLWVWLVARTVAYAGVVLVAIGTVIFAAAWFERGYAPHVAAGSEELRSILTGRPFARFVVLLVLSSFVVSFGLQLRRVLGPETLRALFLGTYRRPRHEERAFAFLDLTDSTAWAERLGPLAFTDFKNDFFSDVAEPVLATGGRIVQYVGDEVMVSWPMRTAERTGAPLRFFFLVEDRVGAHAERYRRRYGDVPRFKAGLHGGPVVTAEVGDLKRDIVHSGDVVNTAARIEGQCRPRGRRLLVSAALLARMPTVEGLATTEIGPVALRGKAEPVGLCTVERASVEAAPPPAPPRPVTA